MKSSHDRAFKEWAVSCEALQEGRQTLLLRKGGIREEGGVFTITEREFFLLPTYEHQNADLLQPAYAARLKAHQTAPFHRHTLTLSACAVVDTICIARDEEQVNAVADEHIWNSAYVKMRFDFNPYDPLYLILLRVYRLPEPVTLSLLPEYTGCKSWVTLERPLSTAGAIPAISDTDFAIRKERLLTRLQ